MTPAQALDRHATKHADPSPTEAQKKAGNYRKAHVRMHGLDIAIENARGSFREGQDKGGKPWKVRMANHYGYIKRTEGADGDHVDVYLGNHLHSPKVYIVHQNNADTGKFDEHKCFLGFASKAQAVAAYHKAFSDGKAAQRLGKIEEMSVDKFKTWLASDGPIKRATGGSIPHMESGGGLSDEAAFGAPPPASAGGLSDDQAFGAGTTAPPKSLSDYQWASGPAPNLAEMTGIPDKLRTATSAVVDDLNPFSEKRHQQYKEIAEAPTFLEGLKKTGDMPGPQKVLADIAGIPAAAVSGVTGPILGRPLATAEHLTGQGIDAVFGTNNAAKDNPEEMYQHASGDVDTAMSAMMPGRAGVRAPAPVKPAPNGPLGVTLSEGQETGALPLIQREQAAQRGQLGDQAQQRAQAFQDQQSGQVAQAKEDVRSSFDPFGQTIAENPQQAGEVVSNAVRSEAARAKAGVKAAYTRAQDLGGEIHAGAFEGMPQKIKGDLTLGDNPVIVDDKLTPAAWGMLNDIETKVGGMKIPNRANPFGPPNPETVEGVSLKGVDQWRKRLSAYRSAAYNSGNATDMRATSAILDAFDSRVDSAINGGLFNGDKRAVSAWNDARAANKDYRSTFSAGKDDPIGRVVEKITGKGNRPAAIPNDVADFLYGGTGLNPNTVNVGVANRIKSIVGEQSPEWTAVKQGLFSRITETPQGVTDWGSAKIAQNINRFLNGDGREMSQAVFSPADRRVLQSFADLHRRLEVPPGGRNYSETSTFMAPMMRKVTTAVAGAIGAFIGHAVAPGMYGMGEMAGITAAAKGVNMVGDLRAARQITRQMPLIADSMNKYQKALAAYNKANSLPSKAALGLATTNLTKALQPLGIDFRQLQGTVPAGAQDQNQNQ